MSSSLIPSPFFRPSYPSSYLHSHSPEFHVNHFLIFFSVLPHISYFFISTKTKISNSFNKIEIGWYGGSTIMMTFTLSILALPSSALDGYLMVQDGCLISLYPFSVPASRKQKGESRRHIHILSNYSITFLDSELFIFSISP